MTNACLTPGHLLHCGPEALPYMEERRKHPRYPACWRVLIHCHCYHDRERRIFDGTTADVSLGGFCVHCDHNLCTSRKVDVILLIPPLHSGGQAHKLVLRGRTGQTVLAGETGAFRTGVKFLNIDESQHRLLAQHLDARFRYHLARMIGQDGG